jgi:Membrane-associated phospholipid phosphatase
MELIHTLTGWDTQLFLAINGCHSAFFDRFMYVFSAKFTWVPLYISVLYVLIKHWKKQAVWMVIALILCIVISDQVSSGLIKQLVQRPRPSHNESLNALIHLVNNYSGGMYGFVSSHAANSIGFALLSGLLFKQKLYTYVLFLWAVVTAYSRIYLGVHYPLDVLGGAVVGVMAALLCYWAITKYRPALKPADDQLSTIVPVIVTGLSFIGIAVYSIF